MEMAIVVLGPLPFLDEQAEGDVEGLLARSADPEVAVALLVHLDEALLEDARFHHQLVQLHEELGGELGFGGSRHRPQAAHGGAS